LRTVGPGFADPTIIGHSSHSFLIEKQTQALGIQPLNLILEPLGRNTAPAAAIAALLVSRKDPNAVLLLMPADHVIRDCKGLNRAILVAKEMALRGYLVTFGIHPRGPDTGYGYIKRGSPVGDQAGAFAVSRFVEKPDAKTASDYIAAGDYYWNSGMFAVQAKSYLAELQRLEPDVLLKCHQSITEGAQEGTIFHLAQTPFSACKSISIDYAVMERTNQAAVVPVEMGWSDIGSWAALWEIASKDTKGNVAEGDVLHYDSENSYLRSEGPLIATVGVSDLIVVASADAVLVASKAATQDIKKIVERLERDERSLHISHRKIHHAWGSSERIDHGENFWVDRITVNPGAACPLTGHDQCGSRWVIVSGKARVVGNRDKVELNENDSYVPSGSDHQLENVGEAPLSIISIRVQQT
jgi:mannose-1-phosphate guanylyltransferase/mannose-1-phosphate guanylyltransferase/mannose-6-phosphate isomerase